MMILGIAAFAWAAAMTYAVMILSSENKDFTRKLNELFENQQGQAGAMQSRWDLIEKTRISHLDFMCRLEKKLLEFISVSTKAIETCDDRISKINKEYACREDIDALQDHCAGLREELVRLSHKFSTSRPLLAKGPIQVEIYHPKAKLGRKH